MIEIFMPKAGMDMEEGTLIRWLKEVGDSVEKDEPIMEIETDKITMEAEAPGSGILLSKIVEEGTVVPVLTVLGYIGEKGEKVPETSSSVDEKGKEKSTGKSIMATPYAKKLAGEQEIDIDAVQKGKDGIIRAENVLATPLAKRMAESKNIDLVAVSGTGHGNKITKEDIIKQEARSEEKTKKLEGRTIEYSQPLKGIRKVVGQRMFESYSQVPTVMQSMKVDLTELLLFRKRINEEQNIKISINDFVIKATAMAVKEFPHIRTMVVNDQLITYAEANIGFAVAVPEGLFVPVIKDADKLSLGEISKCAKKLAEAARTGKLQPDDCCGGTFTVSNMGMYGVYTFNPIINQPESGILGITGIEDVLKMIDGKVVVRKEAVLCMSYDHRVMDGVGAAKLKERVKALLEHPLEILI